MSDKTNTNLKEAGLKATLPRIKILEILQATSGTHHHYTAEDIYRELSVDVFSSIMMVCARSRLKNL